MEISVQCCSGTGHIKIEIFFIVYWTTVVSYKVNTACTNLVIFVIKMTACVRNGGSQCEWSWVHSVRQHVQVQWLNSVIQFADILWWMKTLQMYVSERATGEYLSLRDTSLGKTDMGLNLVTKVLLNKGLLYTCSVCTILGMWRWNPENIKVTEIELYAMKLLLL